MEIGAGALWLAQVQRCAKLQRVGGIVRDDAGQPVKGATVTAEDPNVGQALTATTDDKGRFTIIGLRSGLVSEGNPLLSHACDHLGIAPTLVTSKLIGITLVLLIWRLRESWLAGPALAFTATFYVVISIMPWMAAAGMLP